MIGGETFITMESLDFAQFTGEDKELYYIVAKFGLVDGAIHLRIVNGDADPARKRRIAKSWKR